jgi:hypothetical protein
MLSSYNHVPNHFDRKTSTHRDLDFISGEFFDHEIPKDKLFLLKYFTTELQVAFLRYFLVFGDCRNFTDHTGHVCSVRLLKRLKARFLRLCQLHDQAKRGMTEEALEMLQLLESGQFPLTGK